MRTENLDVDLCDDCVVTSVNGWDERLIGRPLPTPEPLSRLGVQVLVGVPDEDPHFGKSPCDGCGIPDHGNRTHTTIVHVTEE